jgi:hypothetical protein
VYLRTKNCNREINGKSQQLFREGIAKHFLALERRKSEKQKNR